MEYVVGLISAIAIGIFAGVVGFDKERGFYPVVLIVIAFLYLLFAAIGGSTPSLWAESIPSFLFVALAVIGFRKSPWYVVVGLAGHGVFDLFHPALISNPGVPIWWPGFCLTYDVVAAAYLGGLILYRRGTKG